MRRRARDPAPRCGAARSAAARSAFDQRSPILDLERGDPLGHAGARRDGVLHRVAQRRRGVDRREDLAAGRLDVRLESLDLTLGVDVGGLFGRQRAPPPRRARRVGPLGRLAARLELEACRLLPRVERPDFGLDVGRGAGS